MDSYESFCVIFNKKPWPTSTTILEEWEANQIYRSTLPKQVQIKLDIVASYLSALKSYHIHRRLSLKGFDDPRMTFIIKGGKRLFPSKKRNRLPVTKNILEEMTKEEPLTVIDLNVDPAFKLTLVDFMRLGQITYTEAEARLSTFAETKLTRSDISFREGDQYATLRFE